MGKQHGMYGTPTYKSWADLMQRCKNAKNKRYADYGGRGIRVCDRWSDFSGFLADMGPAPPGMTIERNNNEGDYCPENCRWATKDEQAKNKRSVALVAVGSLLLTLPEAAEKCGVPYKTVKWRFDRGIVGDALFAPIGKPDKVISFRGKTMNQQDWASELGVSKTTISMRIKRGWPIDRVLQGPAQ